MEKPRDADPPGGSPAGADLLLQRIRAEQPSDHMLLLEVLQCIDYHYLELPPDVREYSYAVRVYLREKE